MAKNKTYEKKRAKKRIKQLNNMAISIERSLNYEKALIYYKRAKKIAKKWNLNKISLSFSFKIMQILNLILQNKLKDHLNIISLSELNREYKKAYEHTRMALWTAAQLKSIGMDEMTLIIKKLEEKDKYLKNNISIRIFMRCNNGAIYETPTILSKALELIDLFPTSFEIPDNFIIFENGINQKIHFRQILKNSWYMEIPLPYKLLNQFILKFKYLTTNIVKIFTLNFFKGYFISDYLNKSESINSYYKQAMIIIRKIKDVLENYDKCQFCNNQILSIGQNICNYCGIEINYNSLLFPNLREN